MSRLSKAVAWAFSGFVGSALLVVIPLYLTGRDDSVSERRAADATQQRGPLQASMSVGLPFHEDVGPSVRVSRGDEIRWIVRVADIGTERLEDVVVHLDLPPQLAVVPGTGKITTSAAPQGLPVDDLAPFQSGVNLGDFRPGGAAYLSGHLTVSHTSNKCGAEVIQLAAAVKAVDRDGFRFRGFIDIKSGC
jgi:hypothetical protein